MLSPRYLLLLLCTVFAVPSTLGAQRHPVVGTWEEIEGRIGADGRPEAPRANILIFGGDGFDMTSALPPNRPTVNKPLSEMTKEELVARFSEVRVQRGTYSVSGDRLTTPTAGERRSERGGEAHRAHLPDRRRRADVHGRRSSSEAAGAFPPVEAGADAATMTGRYTRLMPAAVLIAAAGVVAVAGTAAQETEAARNAAFVRHCMGLMTAGSVDRYMECWADEPRNNGRVVARERLRETVNDILTTFPDFKFTILQVVADGQTVVVRATQSGTHLGIAKTAFNGGGLLGVAATGRRMEIQVTHWFTVTDGRIVEQQAVRDDLGMMRQLGLAPSPPRPPSR